MITTNVALDSLQREAVAHAEDKFNELSLGMLRDFEALAARHEVEREARAAPIEALLKEFRERLPRLEQEQAELRARVDVAAAAVSSYADSVSSSSALAQQPFALPPSPFVSASLPRFSAPAGWGLEMTAPPELFRVGDADDDPGCAPLGAGHAPPGSPRPPASPQRRIMNRKLSSPMVAAKMKSPPATCPPSLAGREAPPSPGWVRPAPGLAPPSPTMATLGQKPRTFGTPKRSPGVERAAFSLMASPSGGHFGLSPTASPFVILEDGGTTFRFMHRRPDVTVSWGLEFEYATGFSADGLVVTKVHPGGTIDAWNRMCSGGPSAGKEVQPEDRIISTNGKTSCDGMLEEFKTQLLIKFVVTRGGAEFDGVNPPSFPVME